MFSIKNVPTNATLSILNNLKYSAKNKSNIPINDPGKKNPGMIFVIAQDMISPIRQNPTIIAICLKIFMFIYLIYNNITL
jgi:hypothetical protein